MFSMEDKNNRESFSNINNNIYRKTADLKYPKINLSDKLIFENNPG